VPGTRKTSDLELSVLTYREHPSKVVRLAEGQLVAYPPAEQEDCTLWVALQDASDEWEGVLGKRLPDDRAELGSENTRSGMMRSRQGVPSSSMEASRERRDDDERR